MRWPCLVECGDEAIERRPTHDRSEAAANPETINNDMDVLLSNLSFPIDSRKEVVGSQTFIYKNKKLY